MDGDKYVCYYSLIEEGIGYSAISLNLPGCCGQGKTVEAAKASIKESFEALVQSYHDDEQQVPFIAYHSKKGDHIVTVPVPDNAT